MAKILIQNKTNNKAALSFQNLQVSEDDVALSIKKVIIGYDYNVDSFCVSNLIIQTKDKTYTLADCSDLEIALHSRNYSLHGRFTKTDDKWRPYNQLSSFSLKNDGTWPGGLQKMSLIFEENEMYGKINLWGVF